MASYKDAGPILVRLPPGSAPTGAVEYVAACPTDRRTSFAGSALPFASAKQAFDGTPFRGRARPALGGDSSTYEIRLAGGRLPGAFYADMKGTLVPPTVFLWWREACGSVKRGRVPVGEAPPFRSISMPRRPLGGPRTVATYDAEYPVIRSQEAILIASAYPSRAAETGEAREPANFWGTRPPV